MPADILSPEVKLLGDLQKFGDQGIILKRRPMAGVTFKNRFVNGY